MKNLVFEFLQIPQFLELDEVIQQYPLLEDTPLADMKQFNETLRGNVKIRVCQEIAFSVIRPRAVLDIDFVHATMNKLEIDIDPKTMKIEGSTSFPIPVRVHSSDFCGVHDRHVQQQCQHCLQHWVRPSPGAHSSIRDIQQQCHSLL